jgi:N-acetylmuramoyl-L-alanine amidase
MSNYYLKLKAYRYLRLKMKYFSFLVFVCASLFMGCSSSKKTFYELPVEFRFAEKKIDVYKLYSPYLKGKVIFVDPGHGGSDRNNIGFKGSAIEADINLKVALALKRFIVDAGGIVNMSRMKDTTVDLKDRSTIANKSRAEFFISIHHNAPAEKNDVWTNYTSTYYHAKDTDYEFEPCQKDLAKYIQRDLAYAMRNSGGPGSFDGTYSDYNIYPHEGFSVLRLTKIPAVLVECGFTTSEYQSGLLGINEFNEIEAWGIFKGICRYLANGIPQIQYIRTDVSDTNKLSISFNIKDTAGIDNKSIKVFIDSLSYQEYNFNAKEKILSIYYPAPNWGLHSIRIIAANSKGNYAFPYYYNIFVDKKMDR